MNSLKNVQGFTHEYMEPGFGSCRGAEGPIKVKEGFPDEVPVLGSGIWLTPQGRFSNVNQQRGALLERLQEGVMVMESEISFEPYYLDGHKSLGNLNDFVYLIRLFQRKCGGMIRSFVGMQLSPAEKVARILPILESWYGDATTELRYRNPYELAVAVLLSAQCTDVRVNQTTPAFFERFPDFRSLAEATPEEVFPYIRSISYPNSKAQRLVALAREVMEKYGGSLPQDPEALAKLPGIGRKSANVISSVLFQAPVIAVDTHVFRVSRRLGLARGNTPEKVERELNAIIPAEYLGRAHHWLILFGRYHCTARRPKCGECVFRDLCDWYAGQQATSLPAESSEAAEPATEAPLPRRAGGGRKATGRKRRRKGTA